MVLSAQIIPNYSCGMGLEYTPKKPNLQCELVGGEMFGPKIATIGPKLATFDLKLATFGPKLSTFGLKLATIGLKLAKFDVKIA